MKQHLAQSAGICKPAAFNYSTPSRGSSTPAGLSWALAIAWIIYTIWATWAGFQTWRYAHALAASDSAAAISARPDLAQGWLLRAEALLSSDPEGARKAAKQALVDEPGNFQSLTMLAQCDIVLNDMAGADQVLQAAIQAAPGYEGHFQLSSLELLRGDRAEYWRQTGLALQLVPDAQVYVPIQQALRVASSDPGTLLQLLPAGRPAVIAAAVVALADSNNLSLALAAWQKLRCDTTHLPVCGGAALSLTEDLLNAPSPSSASALAVWNEAASRGWLDQAEARVGAVTDPGFQYPWTGLGFGWVDNHMAPFQLIPDTISRQQQIRVNLDGYEPDGLQVFRQRIAVQPSAHYELSFDSRLEGVDSTTGINVLVRAMPGKQLIASLPAQLKPTWQHSTADFGIPAGVTLAALSVEYERPSGQVRIRYAVDLRAIMLRPVESPTPQKQ